MLIFLPKSYTINQHPQEISQIILLCDNKRPASGYASQSPTGRETERGLIKFVESANELITLG